jgi:squalene synthase HpnC
MPVTEPDIQRAYSECRALARGHYENFPIASVLLPRRARRHMYALYAFARGVDDLGDESAGDRLALLDRWEAHLRAVYGMGPPPGGPVPFTFVALRRSVEECRLPIDSFLRLIEANRRDQRDRRYETFDQLLDYCTYSADPVGRLVLAIFGYHDPELHQLSDAICTGLQLANFWQDVARDFEMGRIYIPREDMATFGVSEDDLRARPAGRPFRDLLQFESQRTRTFFESGSPLPGRVSGSFRTDVRLFVRGGESVLDAIEERDYDVLSSRPTLSRVRLGRLALEALGSVVLRRGA